MGVVGVWSFLIGQVIRSASPSVAQIGQHRVLRVGPGAERGEQAGMGAGTGDVVLAARAHGGGPQRPAVRRGHHLHVPAVVMMLARPQQIHRPALKRSCDLISRSRQECECVDERRTDYREVAAVECGNLDRAEPLGNRHHGCVGRSQR